MSTEFPRDIIQTATVAIFSPDMWGVIVIVHEKLRMILPPGWSREECDTDILATAIREVKEEIWLNLLEIPGNFIDSSWNIVFDPVVIHQEEFTHPRNQKTALNSLYFFRLAEHIDEPQMIAELQWMNYTKSQISQKSVRIWEREYVILDPTTKEFILCVMRD
jgi:8-oxo-dGTP pyrophosphatase MutT (NUDIX family)